MVDESARAAMIGGDDEQCAMALSFLLAHPLVHGSESIVGVPQRCQVAVVIASMRVLVRVAEPNKDKS